MFMRASRIARPMTAVARLALPSALNPPAASSSRRTGPFTTISTAQPPVEAVAPCTRNSGRSIAANAANTTEKCNARHPAITALTASFSAVTATPRTGSTPTNWAGSATAVSRHAATASRVGGTTGSPSVQPFA